MFMGFGRQKNIHRAVVVSDMPLFKGGRPKHTTSCVSPAGACMSVPVTLHVTCPSAGNPNSLTYYMHTEAAECHDLHTTDLYSVHVGPLKAMGTVFQTQSQGKISCVLIGSPDIWVRKPDSLCLSYNPPLLGSSLYNLCQDVFLKGPLVRRAEHCTHKPQQ